MSKKNTTAKGRRLEDEVADIYRQLGATIVKKNIDVHGIEVDVYVEIESPDGSPTRYAIDAKNWSSRVTGPHMRDCVNNFTFMKQKNAIDIGAVVSVTGFTGSAQAAAEAGGVRCIGIAELRRRIADFSPYLQKWVSDYEEDPRGLRAVYLPLAVTEESPTDGGTLDAFLESWLHSGDCHITLLGNYGTGKSTTLRRVMYERALRYLEDPDNNRIPIFVELKKFKSAPETPALVTHLLVNTFGISINYAKFCQLNEDGRFLLILDGFDEMVEKSLDGMPEQLFDELSNLAARESKVILSCRTHYFRDPNEVVDVHSENRETNLYRKIHGREGFRILHLNPFTKADVEMYLQSSFGDEWRRYKTAIESTYDLESLSKIPILLEMMVETLPDLLETGESISRSTIYRRFTDKWIKRDQWRRALAARDRLGLCTVLAVHFYRNQQDAIHWSDLPDFLRENFPELIKTRKDLEVVDHDIRTCNFLIREKDGGQYFFVHKSFMEFFVATRYLQSIENREHDGLDGLGNNVTGRVVWEFLLEMIRQKHLAILRQGVFVSDKVDVATLMSARYSSVDQGLYTSDESLGNAAYILYLNQQGLEGSNLRSARFTQFSWNNVSFSRAILTGSKFEKNHLQNVDFNGAQLSHADFSGSKLQRVDFSEADLNGTNLLKVDLDQSTIGSIAQSRHWGSARMSSGLRRKIESLYKRSGPIQEYRAEK